MDQETRLKVKEIRDRAKAADGGPWQSDKTIVLTRLGKDEHGERTPKPVVLTGANLVFLNQAREDVMFLIRIIEQHLLNQPVS